MANKEKDLLDSLTGWYEKNKDLINRILMGVLVVVLAVFAYKKFYLEPRNEKARNAMYLAEQFFIDGNYEMALNGQGATAPGFASILKKYSGTPQANLARFYAGVCYLNMSEYDKAIDNLKKFEGHNSLLSYRAEGCIGDAYAEKGDLKKALSHYKKAASNEEDQLNAPHYLLRIGLIQEKQGENEAAIKTYKKIRSEYPNSLAGADIDKYLARLGDTDLY